MNGTNEVQKIDLDLTSEIVFASTADPYVTVLTEEGQVVLLTFATDRLVPAFTQLHKSSKVVALCSYCDVSGLFTTRTPSDDSPEEQIVKLSKVKR